MNNKNTNVRYTDDQKLEFWLEKIKELEMQIKIAQVRVDHLKFKLNKRDKVSQE